MPCVGAGAGQKPEPDSCDGLWAIASAVGSIRNDGLCGARYGACRRGILNGGSKGMTISLNKPPPEMRSDQTKLLTVTGDACTSVVLWSIPSPAKVDDFQMSADGWTIFHR